MRRPSSSPDLRDIIADGFTGWSPETLELARGYNDRYFHWSDLEYRDTGSESREKLWALMKLLRIGSYRRIKLGESELCYCIVENSQRILHDLDMRLASGLIPRSKMDEKRKLLLTVSSIMEESIASSQLEGASTTTKAAKKMLRENLSPSTRSEQMIFNNYNAMKFIKDHSNDAMSPDLIREIHSIISKGTMDDPLYEGMFRDNNSIAVRDVFTGEIYHEPPDYTVIDDLIGDLCDFANDEDVFVHPIVKGIILHFMLAYIHPFMDGNGRVSRSLFYWYMLRSGYAAIEYLSISKVMKSHRGKYDRAYLLSETDENDITYFINFNLETISEATDVFLEYVQRKLDENERIINDSRAAGLNARQIDVLSSLMNSSGPLDVYTLASKIMVPPANVRRDLERLNELGLIDKVRQGHRMIYQYRN